MSNSTVPPLYKNIDGVSYVHAGNTDTSHLENVLNCLYKEKVNPLDIVVDKYEDKCCVYIRSSRWSLHHSSIINCANGWGEPIDTTKTY